MIQNKQVVWLILQGSVRKRQKKKEQEMGTSQSHPTEPPETLQHGLHTISTSVQGAGVRDGGLHSQDQDDNDNSNNNERARDGSYAMCNRIYDNNRKQSLNRKNSRLNVSANINSSWAAATHKQRQNEQQQKLDNSRQLKLKYLQSNKKLVESSIQATICVERVLNVLCHHSILPASEYQYLNAKNQRSLECKQKRYRNLEAREHKAMLSLGTVGAGSEGDTKLGNRKQASSVHEGKENVVLPRLGNGNNRCSVGLGRR